MKKGKIVKLISNDYTVLSDKLYVCKPRGKFRYQNMSPIVGDNVLFDEENNYLIEIMDRKNSLIRPPVANIDSCFVITSVKTPDFSTNLLDKLLCVIEYNNITPIICFTKLDLLNQEELTEIESYIEYYKSIGYEVFTNDELDNIKKCFKDKITVFTGQSGAGKSTLLNRLDPNLNIKTNEISKALNRGKHTTRHVELLDLFGGLVADTPGFSSLDFQGMSASDVRDNFIEFNTYRDSCRFSDCMHNKEADCEIKRKLDDGTILKSRYENYLKFIGGIE